MKRKESSHISKQRNFLFFFLFVLFFFLFYIQESYSNEILNVHIVPHSHCDPGWLKTYREYYEQNVNKILGNVFHYLSQDSKKTFIWAEISFFKLWWQDQPIEIRKQFKELVQNGQFEFVGGGWVQNDEATVNLELMINQITEGHEFLLHTFNEKPQIGWQVDPFGHSSLTPTLFSAVGYQALVINRIHYSLKASYKSNKHMEFMWKGCRECSPELKERLKIFTHILHTHYAAPIGYDWEEHGSPVISANNLYSRAETLVQVLKQRAESYRSNHLLVPWGDDFKFQNAEIQFSNMDKLIEYINNSPLFNVKIQYSTLSRYFDSLAKDSQFFFPYFEGDFYPYADNEDSYWTGYYASRPLLKFHSRATNSILHSAEMLYALAQVESKSKNTEHINWVSLSQGLRQARRDLSLVTHHDGTTGTSRARVVSDYLTLLQLAAGHGETVIATSSSLLLANTHLPHLKHGYFIFPKRTGYYPLIFHNPLGWWRKEIVSVDVSHDNLRVVDETGKPVSFQITPVLKQTLTVDAEHFKLYILVEVPPLGLKTYFLIFSDDDSIEKATYEKHSNPAKLAQEYLDSSSLRLLLNDKGEVSKVFFKNTGETTSLFIEYRAYMTSRSGAYIFRSEGQPPAPLCEIPPTVAVLKGPLVQELHSSICGLTRIIRLYNLSHFELAYPPIEVVHFAQVNQGNRELVVRYHTELNTQETFFTDNGLEMRERIRIQAKPERNYYPIYSYSAIEERSSGKQFSVLTSQCMGATSPSSGTLELMLHRSLERDDGRGLSEGLKDTSTVITKHWLMLDNVHITTKYRPRTQLLLEYPLTTLYSYENSQNIETWLSKYNPSYSPLNAELPFDIHLLSLRSRNFVSNDIVARFIHLPLSTDSEFTISKASPVSVQLDELFLYQISKFRKTSLTLNQDENFKQPNYLISLSEKVPPLGENFVPLNDKSDKPDKQNSNEDGVFISKSALDHAKQNSNEEGVFVSQEALKNKPKIRNLLSMDNKLLVTFSPLEIHTFLLDLNLLGSNEKKLEKDENQSHEFLEQLRQEQHEALKKREYEIQQQVESNLANPQQPQQPQQPQLPQIPQQPQMPVQIPIDHKSPNVVNRPQQPNQFFQQQPPINSQKLTPFVREPDKESTDSEFFRPFNVTRIEVKLLIVLSCIGICLIFGVFFKLQLRSKRSKYKI